MVDFKKILNLSKMVAVMVFALGLVAITTCPSYAGQFAQKHPRRAEVLRRDRGLNRRLGADRGELGGHYGQLKGEDRSIAHQEQRDARMNGGYITKQQKQQLNHEENQLNSQVKQDFTGRL